MFQQKKKKKKSTQIFYKIFGCIHCTDVVQLMLAYLTCWLYRSVFCNANMALVMLQQRERLTADRPSKDVTFQATAARNQQL